ncbi:hypothetical protein HPB49_003433 [Dermacentor silvarum]|uniref:Uncharacterized protein n=1 Tax=Dermacentor silvarum TaxID=543639 RepID=A0ACB8CPI2_DERSI|nr:hypothetical protein HPB49_003433 [Dermacentor silvarum]
MRTISREQGNCKLTGAVRMAPLKAITRLLFMPSQKEPTPREAKEQRMAATEALHERILQQYKVTEPPREELVAELRATIEQQAKELKKQKRELTQAVDLNKRLTNGLLEKIELAHGKTEKEAEASARALHGNHAESMCADLSVGHQQPLEDFGAHEKTSQVTSTPSLNEGEAFKRAVMLYCDISGRQYRIEDFRKPLQDAGVIKDVAVG